LSATVKPADRAVACIGIIVVDPTTLPFKDHSDNQTFSVMNRRNSPDLAAPRPCRQSGVFEMRNPSCSISASARFAVLGFICLLGAPMAASAAEIETARGTVTLDGVPKRVAVFDIAAVDTISSLGVSIDGLPDNLYLPELAPLKAEAENVGTIFEPNLEALSALGPDLIVLGGRSSPQVEAASQVAQTIDMTMDGDDLLDQAKRRLAAYGTIFAREDRALELRAELEGAVARAREAIAGKGRGLIVMTNGPKISAYGRGSRFGWVHETLGLPYAIENVEAATHGEAISFELIRESNPDWLLVVDRAAAIGESEQSARVTLDNELVASTTAWKKNQVVFLPSTDVYIAAGGVAATTRVLAAITDAFSGTR